MIFSTPNIECFRPGKWGGSILGGMRAGLAWWIIPTRKNLGFRIIDSLT